MTSREAVHIDLETLDWPQTAAVPEVRVILGRPETSTVSIVETDGKEIGIWRVTPGTFSTDHAGFIEFIHILDGAGRLESETGKVTDLSTGVNTVMPVGWRGRWEIDTTLIKVFPILLGEDADFTVHRNEFRQRSQAIPLATRKQLVEGRSAGIVEIKIENMGKLL